MTVGNNSDGQLGDGTNTSQSKLVSMDASGNYDKTNAVAISTGIKHTVVLLNTGEVMTVGNNQFGQLGDGTSGTGTNKTQLVVWTHLGTMIQQMRLQLVVVIIIQLFYLTQGK